MDNSTVYGYVYLIEDSLAGCVKVGFTSNLNSRLKALQIGSPSTLKMVAVWLCPRSYEKRAHKVLDSHKVRSEWFRCDASFAITHLSSSFKISASCPNHPPLIYKISPPRLSKWQSVSRNSLNDVLADLKNTAYKINQFPTSVYQADIQRLFMAIDSISALNTTDPLHLVFILQAASRLTFHPNAVVAHNAIAISRILPIIYQALRT